MDLSQKIADYIKFRLDGKLEKHDKASSTALEKAANEGVDVAELRQAQETRRLDLMAQHKESVWLDDAASRAYQISLVTHAPKFSHGDSKASGFVAQIVSSSPGILGTHSIQNPFVDVIGNAAVLDVANLLLLEYEGVALWQQLQSSELTSLHPFTEGPEQLERWRVGFMAALIVSSIRSHSQSKQIYFPTGNGEYHLISPIPATSIMQSLHEQVISTKFGEEAISSRNMRKAEKGCATDVVKYPSMMRMLFGGSKPQNVSLLNSRRGGKSYLLHSAPPVWRDSLRLPKKGKKAFVRLYSRQVDRDIYELRQYLSYVGGKSSNTRVKEGRAQRITNLLEKYLQLVANIRQIGEPGWTQDCDLPLHERCLLDPTRRDETNDESSQISPFNKMIDDGTWLDLVADGYARWLNSRLRGIRAKNRETLRDMGDSEAHEWRQELNETISRLRNDLEFLL